MTLRAISYIHIFTLFFFFCGGKRGGDVGGREVWNWVLAIYPFYKVIKTASDVTKAVKWWSVMDVAYLCQVLPLLRLSISHLNTWISQKGSKERYPCLPLSWLTFKGVLGLHSQVLAARGCGGGFCEKPGAAPMTDTASSKTNPPVPKPKPLRDTGSAHR